MATQKYDPLGFLYSDNSYAAADGTSFASPIVAGAAALVKQAHPKYTVAQIKSALVNTAAQDVTTDDFGSTVDVEWLGAGRLDAGLAANANVTLQVLDVPAVTNPPATTTLNFGILKSSTTLPVTKQVQITNSGAASVTLAVAVATGTAATGATITTDKTSVTVAAGGTGTFNVVLGRERAESRRVLRRGYAASFRRIAACAVSVPGRHGHGDEFHPAVRQSGRHGGPGRRRYRGEDGGSVRRAGGRHVGDLHGFAARHASRCAA